MPSCSSAGGSLCLRLHAQVASEYYCNVWSVLKEVLIYNALKGVLVHFSAMKKLCANCKTYLKKGHSWGISILVKT